jgi:copper(I)-binding protein
MMIRTSFAAFALLPLLAIGSPAFAQHHAASSSAEAPAHPGAAITQANITLSGGFTRATLPGAPVAGGFVTIANTGAEDDVLIGAMAGIAKETQIHEMAMEGDVMKMSQLADGLVIPAGETVTLAPGGFHIMFMGLNGPLVEGESLPVTLEFKNAGKVTIELPIGATAATAPAHGH